MNKTNTSKVGDFMKVAARDGKLMLVKGGGWVAYVAAILYAEVHGYTLLSAGVDPERRLWAMAGMVVLGLTAILLPMALHNWTYEPTHRAAAFLFYGVDLFLLFMNATVDFNSHTGMALSGWKTWYATNVLPNTPMIAGIGWSILFLLDPEAKAHIMRFKLREAIRSVKAQQVLEAANGDNVTAAVEDAAKDEVESVLTELFGRQINTYQSKTDAPRLEDNPKGNTFRD